MKLPVLLVLSAALNLIGAKNFTNPLKANNGGDPFMVYSTDGVDLKGDSKGFYYLLTTPAKDGDMEIRRATTLNGLKQPPHKDIKTISVKSAKPFWAPEIHKIGGTWYLYYTAKNPGNPDNNHVPCVLKGGTTPWDDYSYLGQLTSEWGIDGSIITIPTYGIYFIWSCHSMTAIFRDPRGPSQNICIAPLKSPSEIGTRSMIATPENPRYDWEIQGGTINEGPQALYHKDRIFMSFSASFCNTPDYVLGLLSYKGGDPTNMDNWHKEPEPIVRKGNGNYGTGHNGYGFLNLLSNHLISLPRPTPIAIMTMTPTS